MGHNKKVPEGRSPFMATLISNDACRKVAFEYFLAAAESDDKEKRKILLQLGRKWVRLAASNESNLLR
jgi:hypothetical protein